MIDVELYSSESQFRAQIVAAVNAIVSGAVAWGDITGTLADQTDLQNALNAKVSTSALSELVDDRVSSLLVAGTNVTLTYDDTANTLTIAASGGGGSGNTYFPSGWS